MKMWMVAATVLACVCLGCIGNAGGEEAPPKEDSTYDVEHKPLDFMLIGNTQVKAMVNGEECVLYLPYGTVLRIMKVGKPLEEMAMEVGNDS